MAKHRGLILYASITGNTEKIAFAFKEAMEECGFEVTMARFGMYDFKENPTYFEDYDFVCLGSPIMAGMPHQRIINAMGLYAKPDQPKFLHMAVEMDEEHTVMDNASEDFVPEFTASEPAPRRAVVFATYGGYSYGPAEATATLELEKVYLETKGCAVVGEFSCCGKEVFHNAVDTVGLVLKVGANEAAEYLQQYKDNPNADVFEKLTEKQRDVMNRCANDRKNWPFDTMVPVEELDGKYGSLFWHYDTMNRPNERDILKAKFFMLDVIEDYFLTSNGKPRLPGPMYRSIS